MSLALPETPHAQPIDDVVTGLEVEPEQGLSADEAGQRLESHGPNKLPEAPKPNVVVRFLSHFNDVLIYVLLAAAVVTAVMGHWVDTVVIALVAVVNATIGFVQEGRAESALTGESEAVEKSTDEVDDDAGVGDRTSMAFSSSMVSGGQGVGVVTATGQDTEIGKISDMLAEVETLRRH